VPVSFVVALSLAAAEYGQKGWHCIRAAGYVRLSNGVVYLWHKDNAALRSWSCGSLVAQGWLHQTGVITKWAGNPGVAPAVRFLRWWSLVSGVVVFSSLTGELIVRRNGDVTGKLAVQLVAKSGDGA
jgi:hypothetical protein